MILFVGTGLKSYGQSYFFFENKLSFPKDSSLTYYTFLTLQNNGSAVARIRYIEPVSKEARLLEINLLDSADTGGSVDNETHYLIPDGEPLPIEGASVSDFHLLRFVFKKQTEGNEDFYVPEAIMYQLPDGSWQLSEMLINQQKSNAQLKQEADIVTVFYNETDEFYQYIFADRTNVRSPEKRKEKLYLITVANTLDSQVGVTTQVDMSNIVATFTQLAQDLNMDIQVQKIMDNSFGKKTVELALAKLRPKSIDIVVFYYSGHGFRYSNDASEYPRISLRIGTVPDIDKNNLGLESIYKTLLKKKAKVTLVLSDCCNDDIGAPVPAGPGLVKTKAPTGELKPLLNTAICEQLFFPAVPVSMVIGSADKFQLAVGNPKLGGYFTNSFTVELRKILYGMGTNATWLSILASTKKQASWLSLSAPCGKNRCVQSARFLVAH